MIFICVALLAMLEAVLYRRHETIETDECDNCPFPRCDKKCTKNK